MPAYNFKPQFARYIMDGDKTHTIRQPRKRPTVKGDALYLYTGMRTKNARRILVAKCKCVLPVTIAEDALTLAHRRLSAPDADRFAHADGFADYFSMKAFFRAQYGLPFKAQAISWEPPVKV